MIHSKYRCTLVQEIGIETLYSKWFRHELDRDLLLPSKVLATLTAHIILDKLRRPLGGPQLDILVSHDMNLYPVRHHMLDQTIEDCGKVEYLQAIAFFEQDGEAFLQSHHGPARPVVLAD